MGANSRDDPAMKTGLPDSDTSGLRHAAVQHRGWHIAIAPGVIIVVCVITELVLQAADHNLIGPPRLRFMAYENFGFWPGLLGNWKPNYSGQKVLMFLTYGFLHGGLTHLIVNMITLYSLGRAVVERIGSLRFAVLYLLTLIGGAWGFGLLSDSLQPMVGASGALFGLAGALIAWNYVDRFTFQMGLWPVARVVLFLFALNVVLWWAMNGQLAWQTHLGGFVTGWVVALLLDPRGRA